MKRLCALFLAIAMLLSFGVTALGADAEKDSLDRLLGYYQKEGSPLVHWWETVALQSVGFDLKKTELPSLSQEDLKEGVTTLVGNIYALAAQDRSPRNAFGVDLLQLLADKQGKDGSFGYLNEHIYAMLALENFGQSYRRDEALEFLMAKQLADGSFAYDPQWGGDPDLTGMTLSLFSLFPDNQAVKACAEKALVYLEKTQLPAGGFETWGSVNSNTIATVITGLTDMGEDVKSEKWHKLSALLESYQLEDGSFRYLLEEKETNRMSTYQALSALGALKNGKSMWRTVTYQYKPMELLYRDGGEIGSAYEASIQALTKQAVLQGNLGLIRPKHPITRAEWITMATKAFAKENTAVKAMPFTDVASEAWYYTAISKAVSEGWVRGTTPTTFAPEETMTLQDAAVVLARACALKGDFDVPNQNAVAPYAAEAVAALYANGILLATDSGLLLDHSLTLEEAALLIHRALEVQSSR